ncbi:MAG TPA: CRTAC1 family protein [Candidatus Didemnitutus sp.]|nr:CRTAC1 family protein [Candidatus Didemnitutus sp.]
MRRPSLPFPRVLIHCCAIAIVAGAVTAAPTGGQPEWCDPSAPAKPQPDGTRRMVELLAGLEGKAQPFANKFFTSGAIKALRARIAQVPAEEAIPLMPRLAEALLNDGQSTAALKQFEEYERAVTANGMELKPEFEARLLFLKALCQLRIGEQQNCILNHNADSCIFPIRGGGVHQVTDGSRGAIALLTTLLERYPGRLDAVWLLNIAYMTLGEYPDKVPSQWRIDPKCFASEYDIKHFPDVAGALGLDVDDLSGGVVMDDFDNDGALDIMASAFGFHGQLRLFHNNQDGSFTECTKAAGLTGLTGGLNMVQADYNNDGLMDVYVIRGAWLDNEGRFPDSLLRNNGDGTFTDVTEEVGLLSFHPSQTAVWFDYNGDGWVDLFVGNESSSDKSVHPCQLFRNNGDGTFTECAAECGVAIVGFVKAVVSADYNRDGRPDLYLSVRDGPNILLRNDGPADPAGLGAAGPDKSPRAPWKFTNVAAAAGVTEPNFSFPAWFWDYDNDGWPDILVFGYNIRDVGDVAADYLGQPTPAERPRLYHNNHDGTFTDVTKAAGLHRVIHAMGSNFGDLDNDGWLDFYAGTGDPFLGTLIPNRMFRSDGGKYFQEVTTSGGFGQLQKGHAIAFGDLNGDGAQDIYSVVGGAYPGDNYHNQLFANPGHGNHWLKLKLEGVESNRAAIGAVIKVVAKTDAGEREIYRTVGSGGSFGASPLRQEIGLGQARSITRVEIFWPKTGKTQVVTGLQMDRCYAVREGAAATKEILVPKFAWPSPDAKPASHHHMSGTENAGK